MLAMKAQHRGHVACRELGQVDTASSEHCAATCSRVQPRAATCTSSEEGREECGWRAVVQGVGKSQLTFGGHIIQLIVV